MNLFGLLVKRIAQTPRVDSFTDCFNFFLNMSRGVRSLDINAFVAFFLLCFRLFINTKKFIKR